MDLIFKSLADICRCAEDAGALIRQHYQSQKITVRTKDDLTPVTQADWDAHVLISDFLQRYSLPIISEESHSIDDPIPSGTFWLVDPLDGTREFLHRTGDFTVNIALIDKNYPVLGVIYSPMSDELFFATQNQGAFKRTADAKVTQIHTHGFKPDKFTVLVARQHRGNYEDEIQQKWPQAQITRLGSAIKYCRIAEGSADLYLRHRPSYEWDTAAGQCLIEEAGGRFIDLDGKRVRYCKPKLLNHKLFAIGDSRIAFRDYLY